MELSVVIVTWNSQEHIERCLTSLQKQAGDLSFQIIIVDNASTDRTREIVIRNFPSVQLIPNEANLGFTQACNRGLGESTGDLLLLLCPHTVVQSDALQNMIHYMNANLHVGALGPQLLSPKERIQPSCRQFPTYRLMLWEFTGLRLLFPRSRVFGAWRMGYFDHQQLQPVDQPMGACLLLRKAALDTLGGLDEDLEMFFSDVDICRRIKEAGWDIIFFPRAKIIHQEGSSIHRARLKMLVKSHRDCYRYFRKYRRGSKDILLSQLLWLALMLSLPIRLLGAKILSFFYPSRRSPSSIPSLFLSR